MKNLQIFTISIPLIYTAYDCSAVTVTTDQSFTNQTLVTNYITDGDGVDITLTNSHIVPATGIAIAIGDNSGVQGNNFVSVDATSSVISTDNTAILGDNEADFVRIFNLGTIQGSGTAINLSDNRDGGHYIFNKGTINGDIIVGDDLNNTFDSGLFVTSSTAKINGNCTGTNNRVRLGVGYAVAVGNDPLAGSNGSSVVETTVFTSGGTFDNFHRIFVSNNSTFNVNHLITGVDDEFSTAVGTTTNINSTIVGSKSSAAFTFLGNVNIGSTGNINNVNTLGSSGTFFNSLGTLNNIETITCIATSTLLSGTVSNINTVNLGSSTNNISADLSNITNINITTGTNSIGASSYSNVGEINVSGGNNAVTSNISSGLSNLVQSAGTVTINNGISINGPAAINLSGTAVFDNLGTIASINNFIINSANASVTNNDTFNSINTLNIISGTLANNSTMSNLNSLIIGSSGTMNLATGTTTEVNGNINIVAGGILNVDGTISGVLNDISNLGTINLNDGGEFASYNSFINNGTININGNNASTTGKITGNLTGGANGIVNIGSSSTSTNFTTGGTWTNIPTINIQGGTTNFNHTVTGVTTAFTVANNAVLNINSDIIIGLDPTIAGAINIAEGSSFNTGDLTISSTGNVTVDGNIDVDSIPQVYGTLTLNSTATANLSSDNILVRSGGTLNLGTSSLIMSTFQGIFGSSGSSINILGNIVIPENSLGLLYTSGNIAFRITNEDIYDSLTLQREDSDIELHGTLQIISSIGGPGSTITEGSWTICEADDDVVNNSTLSPPTNSVFDIWNVQVSNNNKLIVTYSRKTFPQVATGTNNSEVANALETLGGSNPTADQNIILSAIEGLNSTQQLNGVMRQMSPLSAATKESIAVERDYVQQVITRLADLRDDERGYQDSSYQAGGDDINGFWFKPFGSVTKQRENENINPYQAKTVGVLFGYDRSLDDNSIGLSFGYSFTRIEEQQLNYSNLKIKSVHAVVYGTNYLGDNQFFDWVIGATSNTYINERNIVFANINRTARAEYSGIQGIAKGVYSLQYSLIDILNITPNIAGQFTKLAKTDYDEFGGYGANLHVESDQHDVIEIATGLKIAAPLSGFNLAISPELHGSLLYTIAGARTETTSTFIEGNGPDFSTIASSNKFGAMFGFGLNLSFNDQLLIAANYDLEIRDKFTRHAGFLNVKYLF